MLATLAVYLKLSYVFYHILQVFYVGVTLEGEIFHSFAIQQIDNSSDNTESSYTWSDLIQGRHQFSVVAFTSKGPGEAASLMLSTLSNNGNYCAMLIGK